MANSRLHVTVDLTHEEMARIRAYVIARYVPDQRHLAREGSNTEIFALWVDQMFLQMEADNHAQ